MSLHCVKGGFSSELLRRFQGLVKCYIVPVEGPYFMAVYIRHEDPKRRIISCCLFCDKVHRGSFYQQGLTNTWQWVGMNLPINPDIQREAAKILQELVGSSAQIKFTIVNAHRTIS